MTVQMKEISLSLDYSREDRAICPFHFIHPSTFRMNSFRAQPSFNLLILLIQQTCSTNSVVNKFVSHIVPDRVCASPPSPITWFSSFFSHELGCTVDFHGGFSCLCSPNYHLLTQVIQKWFEMKSNKTAIEMNMSHHQSNKRCVRMLLVKTNVCTSLQCQQRDKNRGWHRTVLRHVVDKSIGLFIRRLLFEK